MPNLFSGINLALRALLSHQQVIEVIEHNVANANTPGYHRQEAVLKATEAYPSPGLWSSISAGQFGTGVAVERIRRFNLEFFDGRFRRELAESKRWEMQRQMLQQVEATLAETGEDGLVSKLDAFWMGWQALSNDPANLALRGDLRQRAADLAEGFNHRAAALLQIQQDQDLLVRQQVDEINTLAGQIARLNVEISHVQAVGEQPNDLLDERDRLLDRLAEIAGATSSLSENGEVLVSIGGHALVVGATSFRVATIADPANRNLLRPIWEADGLSVNLERGELAGLLQGRDSLIPARLQGLNAVAYEVATRVNAAHWNGYGLNNATNLDFFAPFTTADYALEIRLSDNLDDLANIAAASAPDAPGDGSLAVTIAAFRQALFMNGGTSTINQFYTHQAAELGLALKNASANARDRALLADSLRTLHESLAGVSLDEEAARLVQTQRAYQAAARLMTAIDEMLDRVINGMGVVGR